MPPQKTDPLDKYRVYKNNESSIETNKTIEKTHNTQRRKTYTKQQVAWNNTLFVNGIITSIILLLDITGWNILQYTEGIAYIATGYVTGYFYYLEWYNTNNPIVWFVKIIVYVAWYGIIIGNILVPASGALFLVCGGWIIYSICEP